MSQEFLSIEPDSEAEDLYKVAILTIEGKLPTGKSQCRKVLSEESYTEEEALDILMQQAKRSFFDE